MHPHRSASHATSSPITLILRCCLIIAAFTHCVSLTHAALWGDEGEAVHAGIIIQGVSSMGDVLPRATIMTSLPPSDVVQPLLVRVLEKLIVKLNDEGGLLLKNKQRRKLVLHYFNVGSNITTVQMRTDSLIHKLMNSTLGFPYGQVSVIYGYAQRIHLTHNYTCLLRTRTRTQ